MRKVAQPYPDGQPVFVDLFCGAGGFSLGASLVGARSALGVDVSTHSAQTYKANFGEDAHVVADLSNADAARVVMEALAARGITKVDLVIGGPPCQGFSKARKPSEANGDPRNALIERFSHVVSAVCPLVFVMENVPGFVTRPYGKALLDGLSRDLETYYRIAIWKLNSAKYGVPQFRERVFVVGYSRGLDIGTHALEPPPARVPHSVLRDIDPEAGFLTVRAAISDLPEQVVGPGDSMEYDGIPQGAVQRLARYGATRLYNHNTKRLLETRLRRIRGLGEGDDQRALPPELRTRAYNHKFRRLRWDSPSPTLTAHMSKDLSDFIHPAFDRCISVREAARLQSFPDRFRFFGSQYQQLLQVGDAVPPLLGRAVVRHVLEGASLTCRKNSATEAVGFHCSEVEVTAGAVSREPS